MDDRGPSRGCSGQQTGQGAWPTPLTDMAALLHGPGRGLRIPLNAATGALARRGSSHLSLRSTHPPTPPQGGSTQPRPVQAGIPAPSLWHPHPSLEPWLWPGADAITACSHRVLAPKAATARDPAPGAGEPSWGRGAPVRLCGAPTHQREGRLLLGEGGRRAVSLCWEVGPRGSFPEAGWPAWQRAVPTPRAARGGRATWEGPQGGKTVLNLQQAWGPCLCPPPPGDPD